MGLDGVMRKMILLLSLLVALPSFVRAQDKPVLAVFEIQSKRVKLKKDLLNVLTEYLATALSETGAFDVIPQATLREELLKQKKASYKVCHDEKCQIEMGRALAANKLLATSIMRIGNKCIVTGRIFDLKKEAAERSAKARGDCNEQGYMASLDKVSARLAPGALVAKPPAKVRPPDQPVQAVQAEIQPLKVRNVAQKIAPKHWKWTIFVEGSEVSLSKVRCVEYTLHPTFRDPVKLICARGTGPYAFAYTANGWGTFRIKVRVLYQDGREQKLSHDLRF